MAEQSSDDDAEVTDVSRETTPVSFAPAPPANAAAIFGTALPQAVAYADLLADAGVVRGLIGPREVPRLWDRHVLNSAALAEGIARGASVADIGSGAGLPGIPLALARPDLHLTLVEPLLRRATFLTEAVDALGLAAQIEVVRVRADALHGKRTFDVVNARAVAPLPRLLEWTMPLLPVGGELLALKGQSAPRELEEAADALRTSGAASAEVVVLRTGEVEVTAIRVVSGKAYRAVRRSK